MATSSRGDHAARNGARASARRTTTSQRSTVAVLYSGRFYGGVTPDSWVQDHLNHLIRPNQATVFVVADANNVCDVRGSVHKALKGSRSDEGTVALRQDVARVFRGWNDLHAKLVAGIVASNVAGKFKQANIEARRQGWPSSLSPNREGTMYNWAKQFELIRQGMAFVQETAAATGHGEYDMVVRMRMDVRLVLPRVLSSLSRAVARDDAIFAMAYRGVLLPNMFDVQSPDSRHCLQNPECKGRPTDVMWHDWVYVGSQRSMSTLGAVSQAQRYRVNTTMRCIGLCQEEQTVLQLETSGVRLLPLGWTNVTVTRLPVHAAGQLQAGPKASPCHPRRAIYAPVSGVIEYPVVEAALPD